MCIFHCESFCMYHAYVNDMSICCGGCFRVQTAQCIAAVLLILLWVARKSLSRFLCLGTEKANEGQLDELEATSKAASTLPSHIKPQLQSWLSTAQKDSDSRDVAVALVEEENRGAISLTEMVNRQGGQISNNALWDEPKHAHIAPAPAPTQPLQPLSVSSVLTSRRWQPESDDSQSTRRGMLASASTAMHSSLGQPQCACLKGRPTRYLNSSLAMKVSETPDLYYLPLALQPQYQPSTRSTSPLYRCMPHLPLFSSSSRTLYAERFIIFILGYVSQQHHDVLCFIWL